MIAVGHITTGVVLRRFQNAPSAPTRVRRRRALKRLLTKHESGHPSSEAWSAWSVGAGAMTPSFLFRSGTVKEPPHPPIPSSDQHRREAVWTDAEDLSGQVTLRLCALDESPSRFSVVADVDPVHLKAEAQSREHLAKPCFNGGAALEHLGATGADHHDVCPFVKLGHELPHIATTRAITELLQCLPDFAVHDGSRRRPNRMRRSATAQPNKQNHGEPDHSLHAVSRQSLR